VFPLDQFQSELDYTIIPFLVSLKLLCVRFWYHQLWLAGSMVGISEALSSFLS